jgi:hypothetical protein
MNDFNSLLGNEILGKESVTNSRDILEQRYYKQTFLRNGQINTPLITLQYENHSYGVRAELIFLKSFPLILTRPLVREGAPQNKTVNVKQYYISSQKHQIGLDTKTYWLTDWPSVVMWLWLCLIVHFLIECVDIQLDSSQVLRWIYEDYPATTSKDVVLAVSTNTILQVL